MSREDYALHDEIQAARNKDVLIADLRAQLAAALDGQKELERVYGHISAELGAQRAACQQAEAERDVLRGVGCLVDGDGPCGVCVKCLRQRAEQAEAKVSFLTGVEHDLRSQIDRYAAQARRDYAARQQAEAERRRGAG